MKLISARPLRTLVALLAFSIVPALAGCPEEETEPTADAGQVATDAGQTTPDAGETPDAGSPDAGGPAEPEPGELGGACAAGNTCTAGTCTELGAESVCTQECLENAECPENLRCEATSADEMYCLFGPRGTGEVGEACGEGKGLGCASGICVDADAEQEIPVDTCTAVCEDDTDCAIPFPFCHPYFALCLPIPSGEIGGICRFDGTCYDDMACTDLADVGERCTITCTTAADCGADYLECRDFSGTSYCVLKSGS